MSVILGVLLALMGIASVTAGGFVLGVSRSYAAPSGFFTAPGQTIGSNGFALTAPDLNGQLDSGWQSWALARSGATIRVTGSSALGAPVFLGVGPTPRVSAYLSEVTRDRITSIDLAGGSFEYDHVDGTTFPSPPGEEGFWVAEAGGAGTQTLEWAVREGDWALVIMNADGSAPVVAEVALGARFGIITPLIVGLPILGFVLLGVAAALMTFGARRAEAW